MICQSCLNFRSGGTNRVLVPESPDVCVRVWDGRQTRSETCDPLTGESRQWGEGRSGSYSAYPSEFSSRWAMIAKAALLQGPQLCQRPMGLKSSGFLTGSQWTSPRSPV